MKAAIATPRVVAVFAVFGMALASTMKVKTEVDSAAKARENHKKANEDVKLEASKPFTNDFDKLVKSASADLTRISQIDKSLTKKSNVALDTSSVLSLVQVTLANFQRRMTKIEDTDTARKQTLAKSHSNLKQQREEWRKGVAASAAAETYELADSRMKQQQKFAERIHTSLVQVSREGIDKLKNLKAALTTAVAAKKPIVTGKNPKGPSSEILLQAKEVATWARRAAGSLKAAHGYHA
eukprot:gnl/MRDRNA2_/MRDRNA2_28202_c0_seq1.p1 gnl/MRDRNA2_/MRDRNA2_28202_c0~~gnl/MRDRNA2_/MRDRNA2_28202_c0_seq1.p1  ORF type:complete len:239 (+),score=59.54 gnl/MRDRNA2_/MRDRNA2_28202_c0_seq1:92-808(+)